MALTKQQRNYAEARMSGLTIKESALAAGCPAKSASQAGSRLERHPKVIAVLGLLKERESAASPVSGRDTPPPSLHDSDTFMEDPKDVLMKVMNGKGRYTKEEVDAAKSLMPYFHAKLGEAGKKQNQASEAGMVAVGRFSPAPPPASQLKLVK